MKHVHLTWYLLVDGTQADPNDCAPDEDGVLRHKDGLAVALREDGVPQSIGVSAVESKNVEAAAAAEAPAESVVQPEPEPEAAVATEIDPVTGKPATEQREVVAETPKASAKNRQVKAGASKKYKTR